MAYEVVMSYHLHMPSYFLGTFTEYPYGTRPRNRFAPQRGLGNFHRCGNQEIK